MAEKYCAAPWVTVFNKYPLPAFNNKYLAELLAGNKPFVMDEALTVEKTFPFHECFMNLPPD